MYRKSVRARARSINCRYPIQLYLTLAIKGRLEFVIFVKLVFAANDKATKHLVMCCNAF